MAARNYKGQQLPWREDPAYIARCEQIANLRAEGNSLPTIAKQLDLGVTTVYEHWDHWLELTAERAESKAHEHIANLEALKRRIKAELDDASKTSLNRSALVAQLRAIEMDMAKLDGSLTDKVEHTGKDGAPLTFTLELPPING